LICIYFALLPIEGEVNGLVVCSPLRGSFVGRHRETAELKAALEDTISGRGRLVMLAGEWACRSRRK
jgi:hypothetical protein